MYNSHKYSSYLVKVANEMKDVPLEELVMVIPDEVCQIDEFYKREDAKPPHLRSRSVHLVCNCSKCKRVLT
jgi:hypothetical protein